MHRLFLRSIFAFRRSSYLCGPTKSCNWRGARVVESGSLENYYSSNAIEGSNPSLSSAVFFGKGPKGA